MAEGIRINDAAAEISPSGLEALMSNRGAEIAVTKLDVSISPEALQTLMAKLAPEGGTPPKLHVSQGRIQVAAEQAGKEMALDLQLGGLRVEITPEGLRLVSG